MNKDNDNKDCPDGTCPINGPASGGYDDDDFGDELLGSLLGDEEEEETREEILRLADLLPKEFTITDRAIKLGQRIGPLVQEQDKKGALYGRALEVGGFFVAERDDITNFRDFIVPRKLHVTTGAILIAEQYDFAARELKARNEKNNTHQRLAAMFHIHPSKNGGLHHSPQDDKELVKLTSKMAKTTRQIFESPYSFIEDRIRKEYGEDQLCLKGDELSDAIQRFIYPHDEAFFSALQHFDINPDPNAFNKAEFLAQILDLIDQQTFEPRLINYGVSIVFNNGGGFPYIKIGAEEKFAFSGKKNYDSFENIPIRVIEHGINIPTYEEIEDLISARVIFPERFVKKAGKAVRRALRKPAATASNAAIPATAYGTNTAWGNWQNPGAITTNYYTALSLSERLELIQTQNEEVDEGDSDLLESLTTGSSVRSAPSKKLITEDKISNAVYRYTEIATMFTLAAQMYMTKHRQTFCEYSTFMQELSKTLCSHPASTWHKGRQEYDPLGLRTSIEIVGEILPDNLQIVEAHLINLDYRLGNAVKNIRNELLEWDVDHAETIDFMLRFSHAQIGAQNKLLETYAESVLNTYKAPKK
ncbi:hypothetical protein HN840_05335 [archaeon]|jgi:hypothetical protein|nr:hypothetical protein [archaeon]MBT5287903.1 hypothetical protein [archaeon]MBT7281718.1 hypothetical protein [archaeon]